MNYQIFLIDDELSSESSINRLLREANFDILPASPQSALEERLDQYDSDLILIRDTFAKTTGAKICERIRRIDRFCIIPIVIFSDSGRDAEKKMLESYRAGAEEFISLALPEEVILEKIFSLIRIRTMYEKLREVDILKDEFLSSVSHELRTPLAIIRENVSVVLDELLGPLVERQKKPLENALHGIDRLTGIVNDLLDMSQLKAGKMRISCSTMDLRGILEEVFQAFHLSAKERGIEFQLSIPATLPLVHVDGKRIRQVLFNLIGNALKFTLSGGRVELLVAEKEEELDVSVRDTGPGIPPEDVKRIFERFVRVDATSTTPGSGVGLSICKDLVEAHGGRIWAESILGEGTVFHFTLPLKRRVEKKVSELVLQEFILAEKNHWQCAVLQMVFPQESKEVLEREGGSEMLEDIMVEAKKLATRPTDSVFSHGSNRVLVVLNKTDRRGGEHVKALLARELETWLRLNRSWPTPTLSLHCFPEDAPDPKGFYQRVVGDAKRNASDF